MSIINKQIEYDNGRMLIINHIYKIGNSATIERLMVPPVTYEGFERYWVFDDILILEYVSDTGVTLHAHIISDDNVHNVYSTHFESPHNILNSFMYTSNAICVEFESEGKMIQNRILDNGAMIKWIPNKDEFGISYRCSLCGHNEFYQDTEPSECEHEPLDYEIGMQSDRIARAVTK